MLLLKPYTISDDLPPYYCPMPHLEVLLGEDVRISSCNVHRLSGLESFQQR